MRWKLNVDRWRVRFRVLTADPPWPTDDPRVRGGFAHHYQTLIHPGEKYDPNLAMERLRNYPIPPMANDSVLGLWRLSSMQEEALSVVRAWGFVPKAELVWLKRRRCGGCRGKGVIQSRNEKGVTYPCVKCGCKGFTRWFGNGRQVRNEHETMIIATKGRNIRLETGANVRSTFEALAGKHSEKPDEANRILEHMYPGPYCELFARRRIDGWFCYGKELV